MSTSKTLKPDRFQEGCCTAHLQLPVDASKQKRCFPMASIKHLITVQLTHSFVCLLNVFAGLLLPPCFPSSGHSSPLSPVMSQIFWIKPVTTSRFPWLDWARRAQSILVELRGKLSDITLALTKWCECPDRGNDTGHIRLNDKPRSSSPFMPALHWITWVCGQVCVCVCVCVCVTLKDGGERGHEGVTESRRNRENNKHGQGDAGEDEEVQSHRRRWEQTHGGRVREGEKRWERIKTQI